MASFGGLLENSLERVKKVAQDNIVQATLIGCADRERLLKIYGSKVSNVAKAAVEYYW